MDDASIWEGEYFSAIVLKLFQPIKVDQLLDLSQDCLRMALNPKHVEGEHEGGGPVAHSLDGLNTLLKLFVLRKLRVVSVNFQLAFDPKREKNKTKYEWRESEHQIDQFENYRFDQDQ